VEVKAMRAVTSRFRSRKAVERKTLGDPAGNGRRSRRERGRLTDPLLARQLE
jgi:hypothetical protein